MFPRRVWGEKKTPFLRQGSRRCACMPSCTKQTTSDVNSLRHGAAVASSRIHNAQRCPGSSVRDTNLANGWVKGDASLLENGKGRSDDRHIAVKLFGVPLPRGVFRLPGGDEHPRTLPLLPRSRKLCPAACACSHRIFFARIQDRNTFHSRSEAETFRHLHTGQMHQASRGHTSAFSARNRTWTGRFRAKSYESPRRMEGFPRIRGVICPRGVVAITDDRTTERVHESS